MKKRLLATLLSLTAAVLSAAEPDPAFPESAEIGGAEVKKRGEYRYVYRYFFKLYDAALYAPSDAEPTDIPEAKTDMRIQFRYLREIEKSIILKSADRMLEKNLNDAQREQIAERVDKINEAYKTVLEGDTSSLTYVRGEGTTLRINGESVVTLEGEDFARLYFRIWLGDKPLSTSLRAALLGR